MKRLQIAYFANDTDKRKGLVTNAYVDVESLEEALGIVDKWPHPVDHWHLQKVGI